MTKIDRLKHILKQQNKKKYSNIGISPDWVIELVEHNLFLIEDEVFGNTEIQEKQLKKIGLKNPKYKLVK